MLKELEITGKGQQSTQSFAAATLLKTLLKNLLGIVNLLGLVGKDYLKRILFLLCLKGQEICQAKKQKLRKGDWLFKKEKNIRYADKTDHCHFYILHLQIIKELTCRLSCSSIGNNTEIELNHLENPAVDELQISLDYFLIQVLITLQRFFVMSLIKYLKHVEVQTDYKGKSKGMTCLLHEVHVVIG